MSLLTRISFFHFFSLLPTLSFILNSNSFVTNLFFLSLIFQKDNKIQQKTSHTYMYEKRKQKQKPSVHRFWNYEPAMGNFLYSDFYRKFDKLYKFQYDVFSKSVQKSNARKLLSWVQILPRIPTFEDAFLTNFIRNFIIFIYFC